MLPILNSNNENYFWQHYTGEVDIVNHFIYHINHGMHYKSLSQQLKSICCILTYAVFGSKHGTTFHRFFKENYYANAIFLQDIHKFNFISATLPCS